MSKFATRLRELRTGLGWTFTELGERSGIDGSYISRLERGMHPLVSGSHIAHLAEALGTSMDYLWGRTDDPTPPTSTEDSKSTRSEINRIIHGIRHLTTQLAEVSQEIPDDG